VYKKIQIGGGRGGGGGAGWGGGWGGWGGGGVVRRGLIKPKKLQLSFPYRSSRQDGEAIGIEIRRQDARLRCNSSPDCRFGESMVSSSGIVCQVKPFQRAAVFEFLFPFQVSDPGSPRAWGRFQKSQVYLAGCLIVGGGRNPANSLFTTRGCRRWTGD